MKLAARDCSPLEPQPNAAEAAWLRELIGAMRTGDHVVGIGGGGRDDDEPVAYCERDGSWWAGRYIGTLSFKGSRLVVEPRFGLPALGQWLSRATNVALVETTGALRSEDTFITELLAAVWSRALVRASRHGLPALRHDHAGVGLVVRGRLDVGASTRLRARGVTGVVSMRRERSLDHAISRAIVACYTTLRRTFAHRPEETWLPPRATDLLPHLTAVTGHRPAVPTLAELRRVRLTPLMRPFLKVAELSRQIANRRGLFTDAAADGRCHGVLLDVAELWELYVLSVLRQAAVGRRVRHGTKETAVPESLLVSTSTTERLGYLLPDATVHDGDDLVAIVDAKYKRLHPSSTSPRGPQREDLYQLTAYVAALAENFPNASGALVYPFDPKSPTTPPAEAANPWTLADGRKVWLLTLPHEAEAATPKLAAMLANGRAARRGVTSAA